MPMSEEQQRKRLLQIPEPGKPVDDKEYREIIRELEELRKNWR